MNNKLIWIIVSAIIIISVLIAVFLILGFGSTDIKITDNGMIIDQHLNFNNQGYTVMYLNGSYYEMGYAHGELLGKYIVEGVNEIRKLLSIDYNDIRSSIADSVWMPLEIEDELDGMVDALAKIYPTANIDKIDLKVINTAGDWLYDYACRSHSCWGRYVADPIKTLSTRRLDFETFIPTLNHHLMCIYQPEDNSTKWINFAFPGIVGVLTGVNEYGTLASIHDWSIMEWPDLSAGSMSRLVSIRYSLTYPNDTNISTHLNSVYNELQNYDIMSSSYLNYYVPEGNAGVMTCSPWGGQIDIYNLRTPSTYWHNGEAIITTNSDTDGSYTPYDEDFGCDSYYNVETPKTLESHWDLLGDSVGYQNLHRVSLAYRDKEDMTIWFDGEIGGVSRTPRIEYEWTDLFK